LGSLIKNGCKFGSLQQNEVKAKLPCAFFNSAPRHEGVLGEWRYSTTHSWPRYQMEVSGQLHVPASFILRGRVPDTHWIGEWVDPRAVWTRWWGENFSAPSGNRTSDHPARSPALYYWAIRQFIFRRKELHVYHFTRCAAETAQRESCHHAQTLCQAYKPRIQWVYRGICPI